MITYIILIAFALTVIFFVVIRKSTNKDGDATNMVVSRSGMEKAKYSGKMFSISPQEATSRENSVDGKRTWELEADKKHDIEVMKRCCDAELEAMEKGGQVPAPYYFERVAILSRKAKNYKQEVFYCEQYIENVDSFYTKHGTEGMADVRKGPRYKAIVNRLPKAKELYAKYST